MSRLTSLPQAVPADRVHSKGNEQLQKAVNDLQKAQADILAQLKETNSKLDKVAASLEKVGSGGGGGGSTGYDTDGSKWDDGSNWNYEGKQSLAIVNTAFNKAKELKYVLMHIARLLGALD